MTIRALDRWPARSSIYALASAFLAGLFLFDQKRFPLRRWPTALAICIVATALAALLCRPFDMSSFRSRALAVDDHLAVTIEMAANKAFCGFDSSIDGRGFGRIIQENHAFDDMPLRQVIEATFGPLSSYCSKPKHPFTHQENALYFVYSTALGLWPNASIVALAKLVTAARVFMIGFIAFAMIVLGFGAFWAFASALLGMKLHVVLMSTHVLSLYSFMTFQLAALCGAVTLGYAAGSQLGWSTPLRLAYGAIFGLMTVAIWNMRTTHGVIAIVTLAYVAGLLFLRGREFAAGANRWTSAGLTALSCLAIGLSMHALLLRNVVDTGYNRTTHVAAHPLVLGLAFPPNPLAAREGIKWDDSVGLELAHRIDSKATYLGPTYERALFSYYFDLWKRFPLEMIKIYIFKFNAAGTGIRPQTKLYIGPIAYWTLKSVAWLMVSGWLWLLCLMAIGLTGAFLFVRTGAPAALGAAFFGAAGIMLLSEHAIILPAFNFTHFGALAEWAFLFGLGINQLIVNGSIWLAQIARKRLFG